MKKQLLFILISLFVFSTTLFPESSFENPRAGIVISKTSFQQHWGVTQMAAHGWAAAVNLAGIPYDCLFLEDLPAIKNLAEYDLLIFGQCGYVEDDLYKKLIPALTQYLSAGGNILIDGPLAVNDAQARERNHEKLDEILGIKYGGFHGNSEFRIKIADNTHYITRPFEARQFLTQHLVSGLNILDFKEQGEALLITTDEEESYPFLACRENGKNRLVLVSDFSTWSGAASFFRNVQPQVFYANQLFNVMIRAIHWAIYGDVSVPFPVPQVSNANLTAIVRLDADASPNLDAQVKTINYLINLAKETGVVPVYAWVSSGATKAGWQDLAPLGKKLEEVGGEIGTHSRFHRIDREMTEQRWKEELDDAIHEIEYNMRDYEYPIGKVEWFINPGNTIYMDDYEQVARRFSFYMTHGFEQDMPLGWGNLTWYTDPHKNMVLLENTPSPDYQWFYDPEWSYTTQQITAYQEAIFDHLFRNIGRGAIFNQMWHDYSITSQPQYGKSRIMNQKNIAMYDAISAKFASYPIYCPEPEDLGHKLRAMAQWDYSWESNGNEVKIRLDLTKVRLDTIAHFTGGMGLKIENTTEYIQSVSINSAPHYAFDAQTVILPNLEKGINEIRITLGPNPYRQPHLTYVSKRMPAIQSNGTDLQTELLTKSKARFSFYVEAPFVLLHADWQEWNRTGDHLLNGYVASDRKIILRKLAGGDFRITRAALPVVEFSQNENIVSLTLQNVEAGERSLWFGSARTPKKVLLNAGEIPFEISAGSFRLTLPEFVEKAELQIEF